MSMRCQNGRSALSAHSRRGFLTASTLHRFSAWTMADKPQQTKGPDDVLSSLNAAINVLNIAKEVPSIAPANAAFSSTSDLLTLIRVRLLPVHVNRLLAKVRRTRWSPKLTTSS